MSRPEPDEYGDFYAPYLARLPEQPLLDTLRQQGAETADLLRSLDPSLADHRYAPGKWTVAEVAEHLIDTERIFGVRALRIARGDTTPLPGFDQDAYVASLTAPRPLATLADATERLRASTVDLFASFSDADLGCTGTASGHRLSARAAGWIIAGHERHHLDILRDRYLS